MAKKWDEYPFLAMFANTNIIITAGRRGGTSILTNPSALMIGPLSIDWQTKTIENFTLTSARQ